MTTWLATPTTTVLCPSVHPFDPDAHCTRLAGHDGIHVAGDGDDWTTTTSEDV